MASTGKQYRLGRLDELWRAHCEAHGQKPSAALKELVRTQLDSGQPAPRTLKRAGGGKRSFHLFFTEAELANIEAKSDSLGYSRTNYLLHVIHAALEGVNVISTEAVLEVREANRQLAAIGRNLNQLVKLSNTTQEDMTTRRTLGDLVTAIQDQQAALARLMERVVRHG